MYIDTEKISCKINPFKILKYIDLLFDVKDICDIALFANYISPIIKEDRQR